MAEQEKKSRATALAKSVAAVVFAVSAKVAGFFSAIGKDRLSTLATGAGLSAFRTAEFVPWQLSAGLGSDRSPQLLPGLAVAICSYLLELDGVTPTGQLIGETLKRIGFNAPRGSVLWGDPTAYVGDHVTKAEQRGILLRSQEAIAEIERRKAVGKAGKFMRRYFIFRAEVEKLQEQLDGLGEGDEVISIVPKPGDVMAVLVLVKKWKRSRRARA